ncbi:MAG: iron-sulfur cluster assembly scaffold protein [Patescibacteria group bacterium]|nr:iron-sulfur cluster assembly scaffold protein [Patescibacteria group bacterium]
MEYTEKVMDHFANPRNVGEIENADGIGEVGNLKCGDVMQISIKVGKRDDEEYIEDIKFKTLGCAAAIASSSMTTELARGKSLDDALKISKDDINEALGKLPAPKYHCSILAAEGIKKAILDYKSRRK